MKPRPVKTMEALATLSGISRPTLSKYFNDPTSVRASTRKRIEAALERHDYPPHVYAINQNRLLPRNIGIVVPYLADPFFAEVARSLEPLCAESGFNPILLSSHGDPDREVQNLDSLRAIRPAGVLLAPLGRRSRQADLAAFCEDVPTVVFDCDVDGIGDAFFGSNNVQSIGLICEYLDRTGEAPAFFEMRDAPNPNAVKRREAYEADVQMRYTHIHIEPIAGSRDIDASSDAGTLGLWTRLRTPPPFELIGGLVRVVSEFSTSWLPGDQGEVLGEDWLTQVGVGLEIDSEDTWVTLITRTRVVARYTFGERLRGFSIGLAASF